MIGDDTTIGENPPTSPVDGDYWFDTADSTLYQWDYDTWHEVTDDVDLVDDLVEAYNRAKGIL